MKKQTKLITLIALALVVAMSACLFVGCNPQETENKKATVTGVYTGERKYTDLSSSGAAWISVNGNMLTLYSDGTYAFMTQQLVYGIADLAERSFEETIVYGTFTKAKTEGENAQYDVTLSSPDRVTYQGGGKIAARYGKEFHIDTADMLEGELARASKLVGENKEYATVDEARTAILAKYAKTRIVTVEMYELDREDKLFNRIVAIKEQ